MLLATTSSSRPSATCRDSPTRIVLSIVLPFATMPLRSPKRSRTDRRRLSQAGRHPFQCTACARPETACRQLLSGSADRHSTARTATYPDGSAKLSRRRGPGNVLLTIPTYLQFEDAGRVRGAVLGFFAARRSLHRDANWGRIWQLSRPKPKLRTNQKAAKRLPNPRAGSH